VLIRYLKFNSVGGLGIAVQLLVLSLLTEWMGLHYLPATALAVESAVLHNFIWHERWTWVDRTAGDRKPVWRRLLRFNLSTGLISILGNLVLMGVFVGWWGLPPTFANVITIAVCHLLNFVASDRFVFKPRGESVKSPAHRVQG
jgi:putative flippase GtrA